MKTDDYAAVYELNRHFDEIAEGIDRLQKGRLLPADSAEARKAALEEIRARTNFAVAQALESARPRTCAGLRTCASPQSEKKPAAISNAEMGRSTRDKYQGTLQMAIGQVAQSRPRLAA